MSLLSLKQGGYYITNSIVFQYVCSKNQPRCSKNFETPLLLQFIRNSLSAILLMFVCCSLNSTYVIDHLFLFCFCCFKISAHWESIFAQLHFNLCFFFSCEGHILFFYLSFVPTLHSPLPLCCICFLLSAVLAPLKGGSLFPRATLVPIIVVTLPRPLSPLTKGCTLPFLTEDIEHFTVYLTCSHHILAFFSFLSFPVYLKISIHTI